MAKNKLSPKQKKFAELYAKSGNAYQSAIEAGYSERYANNNSKNIVGICGEYLDKINAAAKTSRIASATVRQEFWTTVMQGDGYEMKDRLKASELLGKAHQDFVQKVEHSGSIPVSVIRRKTKKTKK